jgi:hypothetical protein
MMVEYKIVTAEEADKLPYGSVILGIHQGAIAITRLKDDHWSHRRDLAHGRYRVLYIPPPELPKVGDVLDKINVEMLDALPIPTVLMDAGNDVVVNWQ